MAAAAACWQRGSSGGGGQHVNSAMPAGMATTTVATAVLPLRAVVVAMKTPAAKAMVEAQTINKQQKSATLPATKTATMTAMTMTIEMKAKATAAEARWQCGGGGQLGGGSYSRQQQLGKSAALAAAASLEQLKAEKGMSRHWHRRQAWQGMRPACWRRWQLGKSVALAAAAAQQQCRQQQGIGGSVTAAAAAWQKRIFGGSGSALSSPKIFFYSHIHLVCLDI